MTGGGKFTFHSGVDIRGPNGTPVYPAVSGTVGRVSHAKHREYVEILAANGRPASSTGTCARPYARASAQWQGLTVLGTIMAPFEHVHLNEAQDGPASSTRSRLGI